MYGPLRHPVIVRQGLRLPERARVLVLGLVLTGCSCNPPAGGMDAHSPADVSSHDVAADAHQAWISNAPTIVVHDGVVCSAPAAVPPPADDGPVGLAWAYSLGSDPDDAMMLSMIGATGLADMPLTRLPSGHVVARIEPYGEVILTAAGEHVITSMRSAPRSELPTSMGGEWRMYRERGYLLALRAAPPGVVGQWMVSAFRDGQPDAVTEAFPAVMEDGVAAVFVGADRVEGRCLDDGDVRWEIQYDPGPTDTGTRAAFVGDDGALFFTTGGPDIVRLAWRADGTADLRYAGHGIAASATPVDDEATRIAVGYMPGCGLYVVAHQGEPRRAGAIEIWTDDLDVRSRWESSRTEDGREVYIAEALATADCGALITHSDVRGASLFTRLWTSESTYAWERAPMFGRPFLTEGGRVVVLHAAIALGMTGLDATGAEIPLAGLERIDLPDEMLPQTATLAADGKLYAAMTSGIFAVRTGIRPAAQIRIGSLYGERMGASRANSAHPRWLTESP